MKKNSRAFIILRKELFRVFGDRKMIFSLFILPAVLVIALYALMGKMIGAMTDDVNEHVSNVVIVNTTPELESIVKATGYESMADIAWVDENFYVSNKATYEDDILNGNLDLLVYLDKDFAAYEAAYKNAGDTIPKIKLAYNSTENYSSQANSIFEAMIMDTYEQTLLSGRFGNLDLLKVFETETQNICKPEKANTEFISMMLPYMIVMLLFSGVMSVGVDALAGEKERGTLASMLLSPAKRKDIVVGKLVSLAIISGLSSLVYSASMIFAIPMMGSSMEEMAGSGFGGVSFSAVQIIELVAIMLALVYLYVGLVGYLAMIAKDTKVASTYISPVYIVVIMAGMLTMFTSGREVPFYRYLIPVYGNAIAIKDLCGNELTTLNFVCSLGGTVLVGVLFTYLITKAFNSEKVMFNA